MFYLLSIQNELGAVLPHIFSKIHMESIKNYLLIINLTKFEFLQEVFRSRHKIKSNFTKINNNMNNVNLQNFSIKKYLFNKIPTEIVRVLSLCDFENWYFV